MRMKKRLNEGNQIIKYTILYCVIVRTFVIPFYYGSGTVINYGSGSDFLTSYGSGSTRQKVMVPTVPIPVSTTLRTVILSIPKWRFTTR
jgi:hypothetical protein